MNAPLLLHDYLSASAQRLPRKVALVCEGERLTYEALDQASDALAGALARRGVERGDRVLVFGGNSPQAVIAFWAILKANAVAVMVNPLTRSEKLAYLLNDCGAAVLIAEASLASVFVQSAAQAPSLRATFVYGSARGSFERALEEGAGRPAPARGCVNADLAALLYTSGGSGEPKGVMLAHLSMLAAAGALASTLEIAEDEVVLGVLPLAFDYGLYQMITAFGAGARLVLERSFAFPVRVLQRVVQEGVTGFPGVPSLFATLGDMKSLDAYDFSRVRYVTSSAAVLHAKHIAMLKQTFPRARIHSMYGLSECGVCSSLPPADLERKPGSVGIAMAGTELWLDPTGQLVVRGPTLMRGYWGRPRESAEKLRAGLLYTGDYCRLDDQGYLYFVGQMDDMIKSRGEKVAPRQVEDALLALDGVKEAVVIGVLDRRHGEAIKAFVVPTRGALLEERALLSACRSRLETFMVPREIVIVPDLPRGANGMVQKGQLS
jgi:acyl-CoA synthetase (AMP-forming)/AMP-acid ligase II